MAFLCLLAVLCVISAVTSRVLTREECAEGPDVWCKDLHTATQCGKVSYCTEHEWVDDVELDVDINHPKKPKKKCKECINIMGKVKKAVPADGEEDEIKEALNTVCDDNFKKRDIKTCHRIVDSNVDAIAESLKGGEDAKAICTKISLC